MNWRTAKIVSINWLYETAKQGRIVDETPYMLGPPPLDPKSRGNNNQYNQQHTNSNYNNNNYYNNNNEVAGTQQPGGSSGERRRAMMEGVTYEMNNANYEDSPTPQGADSNDMNDSVWNQERGGGEEERRSVQEKKLTVCLTRAIPMIVNLYLPPSSPKPLHQSTPTLVPTANKATTAATIASPSLFLLVWL